eukprot:Rmarinus@m.20932
MEVVVEPFNRPDSHEKLLRCLSGHSTRKNDENLVPFSIKSASASGHTNADGRIARKFEFFVQVSPATVMLSPVLKRVVKEAKHVLSPEERKNAGIIIYARNEEEGDATLLALEWMTAYMKGSENADSPTAGRDAATAILPMEMSAREASALYIIANELGLTELKHDVMVFIRRDLNSKNFGTYASVIPKTGDCCDEFVMAVFKLLLDHGVKAEGDLKILKSSPHMVQTASGENVQLAMFRPAFDRYVRDRCKYLEGEMVFKHCTILKRGRKTDFPQTFWLYEELPDSATETAGSSATQDPPVNEHSTLVPDEAKRKGLKFLLGARKGNPNGSAFYLGNDEHGVHELTPGDEHYVGCVSVDMSGTHITCYDAGIPVSPYLESLKVSAKTPSSGRRFSLRRRPSKAKSPLLQEPFLGGLREARAIAVVEYESSVLALEPHTFKAKAPRRKEAEPVPIVPTNEKDASSPATPNTDDTDGSPSQKQEPSPVKKEGETSASPTNTSPPDPYDELFDTSLPWRNLKNLKPIWDEQRKIHTLPFYGRALRASSKNCQLVFEDDSDAIVMMLGKVAKDTFSLDFRHPISAQQAFSIALAIFAPKLVVR